MVLQTCLYLNIGVPVKPLCVMALSSVIFQGVKDDIILWSNV